MVRSRCILSLSLCLAPLFTAVLHIAEKAIPIGDYEFNWKLPSSLPASNKPADIDTNELKRNGWYDRAIASILESEYEITNYRNQNYIGSNPRQDARSFFTPTSFTIKERTASAWTIDLSLQGIYSGGKLCYTPDTKAIATTDKNNIRFQHHDNFIVEYNNDKQGVRQNFIIQKPVPGNKVSVKLKTSEGIYINKVQDRELHFATRNNDGSLKRRITYNSLKAWDANNKELEAVFIVNKKHDAFDIEVNTTNAVYPITIDPLSSTADWIGQPDQANTGYGWNMACAGDLNKDGYSEVIIGAWGWDYDDEFSGNFYQDVGKIFLYDGSATGLSTTPSYTADPTNTPGLTFNTSGGNGVTTFGCEFGRDVNCGGDVNGDGNQDVLIGSPGMEGHGSAFIFFGTGVGAGLDDSYFTKIDPPSGGFDQEFGRRVACAGDVNGDGFSDVLVGAPQYDNGQTNEGRACLFYGKSAYWSIGFPASWTTESNQVSANMGYIVNGAGDVNGDGYSDIAVAAHLYNTTGPNLSDAGRVEVYYGSATGLSATPGWTTYGTQANNLYGWGLACAGDVNSDGYSDLLVTAYGFSQGGFTGNGATYLYYGSSTGLSTTPGWTTYGTQTGERYGFTVETAGDINGDGYADFFVGSALWDNGQTDEGKVSVFYGGPGGPSATANWSLESNQANARMDRGDCAGDVNGDGYSDILISASFYDNPEVDEGIVYCFYGSADGIVSSGNPTNANAMFETNQGNSPLAANNRYNLSAGDINADGYSDVIIGAPAYDKGQTDEGAVFIFLGTANGITTSATPANANTVLESNQPNAGFGSSVSAGDVNGDGYSDVIIGCYNYSNGETSEGAVFIYHGSASGIASGTIAGANSKIESNQANAQLGYSVASSCDVNGDGYGDIVAGSPYYTNGETSEGVVLIYHGSLTGIVANGNPSNANSFIQSNQANARLGFSVNSAGDINGDGFSDLIMDAINYNNGNGSTGRVFIYHGAPSGIVASGNPTNANTYLAANPTTGSSFGLSCAGISDVNGDGFCDIGIVACYYTNGQSNEGAALIYYGGATGIVSGASPNSIFENNQADANMNSINSAGDVNGDGYADVIIGAPWYFNGQSNEGISFILQGSATGFPASMSLSNASSVIESNQASGTLGWSVASAGDVNGDGYSDIMAQAATYTNGTLNEGAVFFYYGNNRTGKRSNLRLYNSDLTTPMQQANMSDPNLFGIGLFAKSPISRMKGKMEWETTSNGNPFSGNPIGNSVNTTGSQPTYTDLGLAGVELKSQVPKQIGHKATHVRARIRYNAVTSITGQLHGPWRYPEGYLRGKRDIGSVALPVRFISFTVQKQNNDVLLKWVTTDEETNTLFEIQYSVDNINFTTVKTITGLNQNRNEYEWLHGNPGKGVHYYRVKAVQSSKQAFTATRQVKFDGNGIRLYPNPAMSGSTITISSDMISNNKPLMISLYNVSGQLVSRQELTPVSISIQCKLPSVPKGMYTIKLEQAGEFIDKSRLFIY